MNAILLTIILIPVIEIYLFIEIGWKNWSFIYNFSDISHSCGWYLLCKKYEGFNTPKVWYGTFDEK